MEKVTEHSDLKLRIDKIKKSGKLVGLVPTMGSLHQGHLSLIRLARQYCDVVVCSIYINPTQFNDQKDFELYPKNLSHDLEMLKRENCELVFVPDEDVMYPEGVAKISYPTGCLGMVMEGKHRKGHFDGVIQVVNRLFVLVNPDIAVFGMKDFQQLAIIKWMVNYFKFDIKIIAAPIVRESDGLAMSSRNVRLKNDEREIATNLYKSLFNIKNNYQNIPFEDLKSSELERLANISKLKLEYLEIADTITLQSVNSIESANSVGVFIAAKIDEVRLIDNVLLF